MKVIEEGKGDWRPWWLGQRMTCRECGRVVELELTDDQRSNWMPSSDDRVTIACERCGNMVRLDRETLPNGAVHGRPHAAGKGRLSMAGMHEAAAGGRTVQPRVRPGRPLDVLRMERGEIRVHEYAPDKVMISGRLRKGEDFAFELSRKEAGHLCNAILAQCRMGLPKSLPWANAAGERPLPAGDKT